jgi:L-lactate dehydrogenase complex protein LldG
MRDSMSRERIIDRFMNNALQAGSEAARVRDKDELNRVLSEILEGYDSIFCPAGTERERAISISPDRLIDGYTSAIVCVEEVSGGIAETGSLICSSQGGRAVQAGLLPGHHVAIVAADNIYATLDDFFLQCSDGLPTNITLETGPSRTADIELILTLGVHGPERLNIIVF